MLLKEDDFPFSGVSFYLKYLIHREIIDLFDEQLENYNDLLLEFREKCDSHEESMKVINYTISKMKDKSITNTYSYLKTSLYENLKTYRKSKKFKYEIFDESEYKENMEFYRTILERRDN